MRQPDGLWQASIRGLMGFPAESLMEAKLHDRIDLIPIVGDIPSGFRILYDKGNRANQALDWIVGIVPVVGDIADFLFTRDTNVKQWDKRSATKPMGTVETVLTGKVLPNVVDKYIGRSSRPSIWNDKGVVS